MFEISVEFLAAGGNEHPSVADVDLDTGVIAFGAGQNIALWTPPIAHDPRAHNGVHSLLSGHRASVTAIKFAKFSDDLPSLLLSGASDGAIRIWRNTVEDKLLASTLYECCEVVEGDARSINAIAVVPKCNLFVSASANASFGIWQLIYKESLSDSSSKVETKLLQTITTKPAMIPLTISIASLPASKGLVLAVAGSSAKVQIYKSESAGTDFSLAAVLSGHEGWIRSLSFIEDHHTTQSSSLLLASASQDKYIRLWRVQQGAETDMKVSKFDALATMIGGSISNKAHRFAVSGNTYQVTFEALLVGHEDWIFNARWFSCGKSLKLLSASADNSLSIWEPDEPSGVWTCTVRLGEISAQKGATTATGSTGGFWLGLWYNDGESVLSLGKSGGWRLWRHEQDTDNWLPDIAVSGHTRPVNGIAWSTDGQYVLSTSEDKTTRLYARSKQAKSWHEMSRPQIHGYDLNCIDTINNTRFISGADEKLLRVFDMPKAVVDQLSITCGIDTASYGSVIEAANMPVLGLSNKAIDLDMGTDAGEERGDQISNGIGGKEDTEPTTNPNPPPTEDSLSRNLLWPETEKLYGHGYEICAVAVNHDGTLVATACKASSTVHAAIRIYRVSDWQLSQSPIEAHSLTVTRLRFSPDGQHLLSVSRDRNCAVFARSAVGNFEIIPTMPQKAHSRMILDATWLPVGVHGRGFATAGRDKCIHLWQMHDENSSTIERKSTIEASAPVTAVDCRLMTSDHRLTLAYGLEDGSLYVTAISAISLTVVGKSCLATAHTAPSKAITQLSWRPDDPSRPTNGILAVASEDGSVRLLRARAKSQPSSHLEQLNCNQ